MKKYFWNSVFIAILTIVSMGLLRLTAAPASPDATDSPGTGTPTAAPTPVRNEIHSIGDFPLMAGYADNSVFEEDMAVNVKEITEGPEMENIVQAVRNVEREADIFSVFRLTLQKNGRDVELTKQIHIRIEQNDAFQNYDSISVLRIGSGGTAQKLETTTENGYICFTTELFGPFVLTGIPIPGHTEPPAVSPSADPTLQNDGDPGIISPSHTTTGNGDENKEGFVTPGAFVFWLVLALLVGIWTGIGIGYILWGRYKTKKNHTGPKVIGE
ncbi:MAG: hypothetical protein ACLSVG_05400 [Clostridia bacterium]